MQDPDGARPGKRDGLKLGCSEMSYSEGDRQTKRIVLIGRSGSGKSSTGNNILGKDDFKSCYGASSVTEKCQEARTFRFGQQILVIDTPGVFDTKVPNKQSLEEISKCISLSLPGPHVFLLTIYAGRFTQAENATVKHFAEVFGEDMFKHTILVFTGRDLLEEQDTSFEEYLKTIPPSLEEILGKCKKRCIVINNCLKNDSSDNDARNMMEMINKLVESHQDFCYTNEMFKAVDMKLQESKIRRQKDEEKQKDIDELKKELQHCREELENSKHHTNDMFKAVERKLQESEIRRQKDEEKQKEIDKLKKELQHCREELDNFKHQHQPASFFTSDIDEFLFFFVVFVIRDFVFNP